MKQKIYILGIASAIILVAGTLFKLNHWPASGILLTVGTVCMVVLFLPAALINHYRSNPDKQYRLLYLVIWFTCALIFTAGLYKIMHWPGAGYFLYVAIPFPFVVFLPVWLFVTSKIKNFDINNTIYILFLLALQAVFSVLLALNVSKEKIDSSLQVTSQLTSFNEKIATLKGGSDKSALMNSADELMAQIKICRQLIYSKTGLSAEETANGSSVNRYIDSRNIAPKIFLSDLANSPATKFESLLKNYVTELGKLPGSQSMVKQANDLFELDSEAGQEDEWSQRMFADYLPWLLVRLDAVENFVRVISTEV